MINLIITDDEETTRNSLMNLIPWDELGVDEVRTAENGLDALELAQDFFPSILLTDVRMPIMDGIELSKKIRQCYPDCKIIFLSGYSDKEYLKSAIQLNAVDYLEKPIDIEELKSLIKNIIVKLSEDRIKTSHVKRLENNFNDNIYLLRHELSIELILNKTDLHSLIQKYGHEVLQISINGPYTIICIAFNWYPDIQTNDKSLIKNAILKLVNNKKLSAKIRNIAGFINENDLVIIVDEEINWNNQGGQNLVSNLLRNILNAFPNHFTISVGISSPSSDSGLFSHMYKSAVEAINQQFYEGVGKVYFPQQPSGTIYEIGKQTYLSFKKKLRNSSVDEAVDLIRNLNKDILKSHDPDINKIKKIFFNLLSILYECAAAWDFYDSHNESQSKNMWQDIDSQITLNDLSEFLIANIKNIIKKSNSKETQMDKIDMIKNYILKNYNNNQLSTQSLAEYFHLNQTYLCTYFKKATGSTINEYITELRIEKAKELMTNRRTKLYDVTTSVGFTDVNYFSTLFKRYTGLSPSDFRKKILL